MAPPLVFSLQIADKRVSPLKPVWSPFPVTLRLYAAPQHASDVCTGFLLYRVVLTIGRRATMWDAEALLEAARNDVLLLSGLVNDERQGVPDG